MDSQEKSVLFVCMGNTCRSTMAEGIFRHLIKQRGIQDKWKVDSAATADWQVGNPPDAYTMMQLEKNGINGYQHTARQITLEDFKTFKFILGMDNWNLTLLEKYKPVDGTANIGLLGQYDLPGEELEIWDPFMDGIEVFENVFAKCYRCCDLFLKAQHPELDS